MGFLRKYLFESFLFFCFLLAVVAYVVFLKTHTTQKKIYVEMNLGYASWWQGSNAIPAQLVSNLQAGQMDDSQKLKISEVRYFPHEILQWEVDNKGVVGLLRAEITADQQGSNYFYNQQSIQAGNPLVFEVNNQRFEFLITQVKEEPITDEFKPATIQVKVYEERQEIAQHLVEGLELKDSNGFTFGKITSVHKENSLVSVTDQWGNRLLRRDPLNYDVVLNIELLTKKEPNKIIGYDGRTITVGKRFLFSHPLLLNMEGYIVNVE